MDEATCDCGAQLVKVEYREVSVDALIIIQLMCNFTVIVPVFMFFNLFLFDYRIGADCLRKLPNLLDVSSALLTSSLW